MILTVQNPQPENSSGRAARTLCYHVRHRATYLLTSVCFLFLLSGCKYDGSFMQMNSDSGSPFFGLQLAVKQDSRDVSVLTAHQGTGEDRTSLFLRSRAQLAALQRVADPSTANSPREITLRDLPRDSRKASHPRSDRTLKTSGMLKSPDIFGTKKFDESADMKSAHVITDGHVPWRPPVTVAEVHRQLNDF